MKKGSKAFAVTDFEIKEGEYISRGTAWHYVLLGNGNVQGYADHVVFPTREAALEHLVNELKLKVIKDYKLPEVKEK